MPLTSDFATRAGPRAIYRCLKAATDCGDGHHLHLSTTTKGSP